MNPSQYSCDRLQSRDHIFRLLQGGYYNLYMFRRSVPACDTGNDKQSNKIIVLCAY